MNKLMFKGAYCASSKDVRWSLTESIIKFYMVPPSVELRYLYLLFQASYSNHRRSVSMAGQKRYLGYINHPNTKGWDGA